MYNFSNIFVNMVKSRIMLDPRTGLPRGFGFVTYENPSVIDKVIEDTHVINGKQVDIRRTIPKGVVGTKDFKTRRILVTGIPSRLSEGDAEIGTNVVPVRVKRC